MNEFRNLAEGEEVEMETKDVDKGAEATVVTGPRNVGDRTDNPENLQNPKESGQIIVPHKEK